MHVDLHSTLQHKLTEAAKCAGLTEDAFIARAVADAIQELEDMHDAEAALKEPGKRLTLLEMERELGIFRN